MRPRHLPLLFALLAPACVDSEPPPSTLDAGTPEADEVALAAPFITPRLCFQMWTSYTDTKIGEDYWTNDTATFRILRGADIKVFHDGTSFAGRLGDGLDGLEGCLDVSGRGLETGDLLTIEIYSSGHVNDHDLRVENESTGDRAVAKKTVVYKEPTDGAEPFKWTMAESARERFLIYMAASYAMYRHGGTGDGSLTIKADATGGTRLSPTTNTIFINTTEAAEKFSIAHEVGHFIARDSGAMFNVSTPNPCGANHGLTSKETVRCAAMEGFADFYAADVFNDHDGDDCWVKINGSAKINCQDGTPDFPARMMENNFPAPYAGFGVEIDWMRVFWGVHTRGSNDPSLNAMLRWMAAADDAEAWTNANVFDLLNAEANRRDGAIDDNWDDAKFIHGVDHLVN